MPITDAASCAAILSYNDSGQGEFSNVIEFAIDAESVQETAGAVTLTLEPVHFAMIDEIPPDITITDPAHEEILQWDFYSAGVKIDDVYNEACLQRSGDSCTIASFLGSDWTDLRDSAEWGDQIAISVQGRHSNGNILSRSTEYVWTYVPERVEFTIDGEETVYFDKWDYAGGTIDSAGFTVGAGDLHDGLTGSQDGIVMSVNGGFSPGTSVAFECPATATSPTLQISTKDGRKYQAHGLTAEDADCSGFAIVAPQPLAFANGYVWEVHFSARIKRAVNGGVEVKNVTGKANFWQQND